MTTVDLCKLLAATGAELRLWRQDDRWLSAVEGGKGVSRGANAALDPLLAFHQEGGLR